jgi:propanol-preferring alcohol dehydrogenase
VQFDNPYKVQDVLTPTDLAPNDLLIRVAVASLCHTDFMVIHNALGTTLPCIGSHEGAGTVVATGSSVSSSSFKVGDRVMAGIIYHPCGVCADCLGPSDYTQYCTKAKYCGIKGADGFFAEYTRIDATQAAKLPDRVSFETAAPLACAGCTIYRGVILAGVKKGEWVGIVGSGGGLGHLGIRFAKALGLNVIGIDARDEGLELTKKGGADVVIDARIGHDTVVERAQEVTNGEGVTATINVSDAEKAVAMSCAITKMHSRTMSSSPSRSLSSEISE